MIPHPQVPHGGLGTPPVPLVRDGVDSSEDLLNIIDRNLCCQSCRRGNHAECTNEGEFLPTKEETHCHCKACGRGHVDLEAIGGY